MLVRLLPLTLLTLASLSCAVANDILVDPQYVRITDFQYIITRWSGGYTEKFDVTNELLSDYTGEVYYMDGDEMKVRFERPSHAHLNETEIEEIVAPLEALGVSEDVLWFLLARDNVFQRAWPEDNERNNIVLEQFDAEALESARRESHVIFYDLDELPTDEQRQ